MQTRTTRNIFVFALFAFFVGITYANTLHAPFLFDDAHNIQKNHFLKVTSLTPENLRLAAIKSPCPTRPISNISFALNYYFHRDRLPGYHLLNIAIHLLTGLFLYMFLNHTFRLLKPAKTDTEAHFLSACAALLWLVHPLQTQAVTYLVQRMTSLSAMFYILSMLLYIKGRLAPARTVRQIATFAGCGLAGLLALGSKEIAATLPFFIFLYEWYFFQDLDRQWLKKHVPAIATVLATLIGLTLFFLGHNPIDSILGGFNSRPFTLSERVLTEFRVVIFYISLIIFPHPGRLSLTHDFPISTSLLSPPTTLLAIVALGCLLAGGIITARKNRFLSFAILWFLGNMVIESSVIPLEIIFEHRNYLPSMLIIALPVLLAPALIRSTKVQAGLFCAIILLLSFWTQQRNQAWQNEFSFWSDCVTKSPNNARAHAGLGSYLVHNNQPDKALPHFQKALAIKKNDLDALFGLGTVMIKKKQPNRAIIYFRQAIRVSPNYHKSHYNMGIAQEEAGQIGKATLSYRRAIQINPYYSEAYNNLGILYGKTGRLQQAIDQFRKALALNPEDQFAKQNLSRAEAMLRQKK